MNPFYSRSWICILFLPLGAHTAYTHLIHVKVECSSAHLTHSIHRVKLMNSAHCVLTVDILFNRTKNKSICNVAAAAAATAIALPLTTKSIFCVVIICVTNSIQRKAVKKSAFLCQKPYTINIHSNESLDARDNRKKKITAATMRNTVKWKYVKQIYNPFASESCVCSCIANTSSIF